MVKVGEKRASFEAGGAIRIIRSVSGCRMIGRTRITEGI